MFLLDIINLALITVTMAMMIKIVHRVKGMLRLSMRSMMFAISLTFVTTSLQLNQYFNVFSDRLVLNFITIARILFLILFMLGAYFFLRLINKETGD